MVAPQNNYCPLKRAKGLWGSALLPTNGEAHKKIDASTPKHHNVRCTGWSPSQRADETLSPSQGATAIHKWFYHGLTWIYVICWFEFPFWWAPKNYVLWHGCVLGISRSLRPKQSHWNCLGQLYSGRPPLCHVVKGLCIQRSRYTRRNPNKCWLRPLTELSKWSNPCSNDTIALPFVS